MVVNTVTEAKARLSELLARVQEGEEVVINRAGRPVALLVPYRRHRVPRKPGSLKGKVRVAPDFDELPEDVARPLGLL